MYTTLINYIYNRVYDNGNGEINPTKVRQCFQEVANELGLNANFMGIITPSDTPASGDVKMLYLAVPNASDRTFTNFGGSVSVPANSMAIFYYDNDQWNSEVFGIQQATDTLAGIVELATDAETQAGTATDKAVTPHGLAAAVADLDGVLLVTINNNNTASHSRDEIVQAVTDGKAVAMKLAINGNIIPVTVKYTETVAKLERVRIETAGSGSPYNRISLDTYNIDNSKNVSTGYNHSYASTANTSAQRDTLTLTVTHVDFMTAVSQSKLNQGCIYRISDNGNVYLATGTNTFTLLTNDVVQRFIQYNPAITQSGGVAEWDITFDTEATFNDHISIRCANTTTWATAMGLVVGEEIKCKFVYDNFHLHVYLNTTIDIDANSLVINLIKA